MNGRCETDPFEKAVDVCGMCYGDFCASCLVTLKRRKYPLCKECAVIASGIRGGGKPKKRGDKKTAKKRREYFQSLGPGEEVIRYFDVDLDPADLLPPQAPAPAEPTKEKSKRSSRKRKAKARAVEPPALDKPLAPTTPVEDEIPQSAIDQLHQLRQDQEGDEPALPAPDSNAAPTPAPEPPVDVMSAESDPGLEPSAAPAPPTPASESAAEPLDQGEPVAEAASTVGPTPTPKPKPPPRRRSDKPTGPKLGDLIQTKKRPAPPKPATKSSPATKKSGTIAVADPSKPPEWPSTPPAKVEQAELTPDVGPLVTPGPNLDDGIADPFASKPVPATVGSTLSAKTRHVDSQSAAADAGDTKYSDIEPGDIEPGDIESGDIESGDVESNDVESSDIDKRGEWVPPVLRGMAPDASEAKSSLPSRRRSDD